MNITYEKYAIINANEEYAYYLYKWWNDGKVMAHAGFPKGLNITKEEIIISLALDNEDKRRHIILYENNPIGEMNYRKTSRGVAEIGIKICEENMQNKGHGEIIMTLFIDCLFNYYDCEKIVLDTNAKNLRARYFYEVKLGFKKVKEIKDSWKDQLGILQTSIDYELEKKNWKKKVSPYKFI